MQGTRQVSDRVGWLIRILAILIGSAGLLLSAGGIYLIVLGGSWYFALTGAALIASGIALFRLRPIGAWIFGATCILTIPWALFDAGWTFWPLFSRLFAFGVAAVLVALAYPRLDPQRGRFGYAAAAVVGALVIAAFISAFFPKGVIALGGEHPSIRSAAVGPGRQDWADWGGDAAGTRFAAFDQINKDTVGRLKLAWTYRTGFVPESTGSGAEDQNTPLQIGDTLYVCTAYGQVFALDVDSGERKWLFDPKASSPNWQRCRGLGYHEDPVATAPPPAAATGAAVPGGTPSACHRRLFLPTIDARLIALDAATGRPCASFGSGGVVDLSAGMGEVKPGYYQQTSTPLVAGDLVVVGGRVADNWSTDEPPGVVRAFDASTGALRWAWDPGNPAVTKDPIGASYSRGTPNVWSAMSYDPALGLIYLPTGNATPDFWGGHRTPEQERFSSSIVAVDAATGRPRWSFQGVHHDLWDFDMPAQPVLYDIPDGRGGSVPALVAVTKQGMIFLLNRATGRPLAKVEEQTVPRGDVAGERYSPTQPYSVGMPMIGAERLVESDMWGATPFDQLLCRIAFKRMRHQGIFTPPGLDRALQMPGSLGGMNWGSVSVDKTRGLMFVNDMRIGLANYNVPRAEVGADVSGIEMGMVPMQGTPFGAMRERFVSVLGIPCQKPPFGTMSAIDLRTRKLIWQVPLGTVQDTGPLNIPMLLPLPVGMPTLGPSLATGSGLVFFAGTQDFYLRALDGATGRELWKGRLPVGSQGGPMTYVSPKTGKQYVVVTAGGARMSPKRGDYIMAYALP